LYFAGRADDLLKVGGLWVAPREIEDRLLEHEGVSMAAVVGVEHEGLIKAKAFVVLRGAAEARRASGDVAGLEAELLEHLRAKLARYKVPKLFAFELDLPKNDRGKVDKKALAKRATDAREGENA
jgi:acyl-coenzyme A synthetase/AMP-(fatty) acid ligase